LIFSEISEFSISCSFLFSFLIRDSFASAHRLPFLSFLLCSICITDAVARGWIFALNGIGVFLLGRSSFLGARSPI
ncbi:hypothetical protein PMAYCL1PPCAC_01034, partial [Pristionchus mayeri]